METKKNLANHSANVLSGIAGASSAGVSACAGGVCAVAAQTGATWAAGGAAGAAGAASASGAAASYPWWNPSGSTAIPLAHTASLPWWAMLALAALWLSTIWTVIRVADTPRAAWIAGIGSILITIGDLHWLHAGHPMDYLIVGAGMVLLLVAPMMPRWNPRKCVEKAVRYGLVAIPLFALAVAFWLQWAYGWAPCPLCWIERGEMVMISFAAARNRSGWPLGFSGIGFVAVLAQGMESAPHPGAVGGMLTQACSAIGPSCGAAGVKLFLGWPIDLWTGGLFVGLILLSLLHARKFLGMHRAR